jgi:hypothetical protein
VLLPLLVGAVVVALPVPAGLTTEAWRYFAVFLAVIVSLITEPIPGATAGLIGITVATTLLLVAPRPVDSNTLRTDRLRGRHGMADVRRLQVRARLRQTDESVVAGKDASTGRTASTAIPCWVRARTTRRISTRSPGSGARRIFREFLKEPSKF